MARAHVQGPDDPAGLVRRAQRGDAFAMDELLELLEPHVGQVCARIARQDAADAAQESMIAIFRRLGQLKAPEALIGWARAIAVREAVRVAIRSRRVPAAETLEEPDLRDAQLAADIRDVLSRLTPEHRAVLTMRHVEGLDEREVAGLLDVPVGTVRSRLFRARSVFRRSWAG